ncbi:zinc-ribbon domain-containing protein [Candidatus Neptunichlamydia sp. REUL1]|uniref:zinc-ribbon domain-containing protein n=1 Tax=Candidatus Neptunichlamydia sp. REUL1 TaxID=3064277 RepID=UPI00292D6A7C|nr:zinc-ribbon domain-containing protein [Candidatus Neptunochlamydia sp. REUL1]
MYLRGIVLFMLLLGSTTMIDGGQKKEVPIDWGWICPQCRHGNPDDAKRCEYCGKTK